MSKHVAIIGGGYSGALQAIQLLRRGAEVTLIERSNRLARGLAYATPHPDHLLNVRACGMSAFPDAPDHFATWLEHRGLGDGETFAERRLYGSYLEELLASASAAAGQRFRTVQAQVVDISVSGLGEAVRLEDGGSVSADKVILALGNLAPATLSSIGADLRSSQAYVADPWASKLAEGLDDADTVLLIGTGLTALDAALMLESGGFRGRILALSRRGLAPRTHSEGSSDGASRESDMPAPNCASLVRMVRSEAEAAGWRAAVDRLRPVTQQLWATATPRQRRRFLRHLRPYWDVHRHRVAPAIARRIEAMVQTGRLRFAAGQILSTAAEGDGALVTWRPRGSSEPEALRAARFVNCTGPQCDIARAGDPLLDSLVAAGRIRSDGCRIGIDVDADCRTIDADGQPSSSLYAIGPMTRGTFWEIVAVPDIRDQVDFLADRLAA